MLIEQIIESYPISNTTYEHWVKTRPKSEVALDKFLAHGGDPWVIGADGRHFAQFATEKDAEALGELTAEEAQALLAWDEQDWAIAFKLD